LRDKGLTLTELVLTLAILAAIAALTLPNLTGWIRHYRARRVVRELVCQMELAKIKALKTNRQYRIAFDPSSKTFRMERGNRPDAPGEWVQEGGIFRVPHQISLEANVEAIRFNPDGTALSGSVTIRAGDGEYYTVTANTSTGKINVARGK